MVLNVLKSHSINCAVPYLIAATLLQTRSSEPSGKFIVHMICSLGMNWNKMAKVNLPGEQPETNTNNIFGVFTEINSLEINQWIAIDCLVTTILESFVKFSLVLSVGFWAAVRGELCMQLRVNMGVTIEIELVENS